MEIIMKNRLLANSIYHNMVTVTDNSGIAMAANLYQF